MIRLLEATARAERDHFWFRGFRRFVEPLVADAGRGDARRYSRLRMRHRSQSHLAAALRSCGTASISPGQDLQFARQRGERLIACATAAQLPFPSELLRPRHVVRRASTRSTTRPNARRSPKCSACSSPGGGWSSTSQRSTCSGETTLFFRAKCAVTAGGTCGGVCEAAGFIVGE